MPALPRTYAITGEAADERDWADRLRSLLERAPGIIQLRAKSLHPGELARRAALAAQACRAADIPLLLNGPVPLVRELELDGVHLDSVTLMSLAERPLSRRRWVAASCHDAGELAQARAIGADFACLSPVLPTASHPGVTPLGWDRFAKLASAAGLPVFALGGVTSADLERARAAGAHGVAGIGGWWG